MTTLAGSVVQLALEIITRQLARAGASSQDNPIATQVLKDLGGYTSVVQDCVERVLKRFADNPRARPLLEYAYRTLRGQVPALRARVQSMLARLRLPVGTLPAVAATTTVRRAPLTSGAYPKVELRARRIGWKGKVDLLVVTNDVCEITDFETGTHDEAHHFQVRVYALLWILDDELNPEGRPIERLVLAYENQDVEVQPPSTQESEALTQELVDRGRAAEAALATQPPVARPRPATCRYCGVRQLCDEYWSGATHDEAEDARLGDFELEIVRRHSSTSWDAVVLRSRSSPAKTPARLRLQLSTEFNPGCRVRVLDAARAIDPEDTAAPIVVTLGALSETYPVDY